MVPVLLGLSTRGGGPAAPAGSAWQKSCFTQHLEGWRGINGYPPFLLLPGPGCLLAHTSACPSVAWAPGAPAGTSRGRSEGARRLSGCVTGPVLRAAELPVLSWCVAGCVSGGLPGAEGLAGAGCGDGTGQWDRVWSAPGCGGSLGAMQGAGSSLLARQHVLVPQGFRGNLIPQHEQL